MKLPVSSESAAIRRLIGLFLRFKGEFFFTLSLQFLVAIASVVTPWMIGYTIDAAAVGENAAVLKRNIFIVIVTVLISAVLAFLADYYSRVLGQKIFHVLRVDLVRKITHLPLSVVEAAGTGDLLGRTTSDVDRVEYVIRVGVSRLIIDVLTILVTVGAAVAVYPTLGIVVLVSFVPMYYVLRVYMRRAVAAYLAHSSLQAELSGVVTETVENSETVDSLQLADLRIYGVRVLLREMWNNERYTALQRVFFMASQIFVLFAPVVIAVLWGAWLVGAGVTTVGAVTAVALYAYQLRTPIEDLGWWCDELQYASVALARIFGVDEVEPDRQPDPDARFDGDTLRVQHVNFSYKDTVPVLKDVSLIVEPGERLAIVGPSGAGKSTLGRLIAGINPPDSGSVQIGGVEVTALPEALLHRLVALVTQENHVFAGTIADNLHLAKPSASDAELEDALRAVDAMWVMALEDGIHTRVGSGQMELPPAHAQQLALARIVLVDPDVIILDEATSLLDPTAARSAERALARVLEGRTVISIAHRLYTAYDADRVAVMIDGEIVELGSHHELVELGGEYAALWNAWQRY